jgi:hypothetical protein
VQKTTLEWVILADLALGGVGALLMPQQRGAAIQRRSLAPREPLAQRPHPAEDKTLGRNEAPERPPYGLPCERGLAEPRYQLAIGEDRRMA